MRFMILALGLMFNWVYAAEPTCHTGTSASYCRYQGKVDQLYVNDIDMMLLYFDAPVSQEALNSVGFTGITQRAAAVVRYKDSPEFSQFFYSTALAAQASEKDVVLQLRDTGGAYLKIDRIWIKK